MVLLSDVQKTNLLKLVILTLIALVALGSRLFSVIRFESIIHEFDPWFNYRTTRYLVQNGFYEFWNWFDETAWYPLGRVVGGTLYPGLMVTAAILHNILHAISLPVDIRNVCVFFAPVFSGLTAFTTYLFTKELKDSSAGLLAAIFVGIAPGYISRSVAGSYDNEGIAIFLLMLTFYLWLRAIKLGSVFYAAEAALAYFYMVAAWGGYVFIINLIPLHVLALILMGRYSSRIYVAYSTFYALGTVFSMQVPFVGFQPIRTSEHMAALGVFGLLQLVAFADLVKGLVSPKQFKQLLQSSIVLGSVIIAVLGVALSYGGNIAPWAGRFYSLWDTSYARKHIPIIASVSEHQPTAWPSFIFDLQILMFLFPAGVYLCFRELRDEHVFLILYSVTASYFAGVMVRLMLTLTPIACVASGVAASMLIDTFVKFPAAKEPEATATKGESKKEGIKEEEEVEEERGAFSKTIGYIKGFDTRLVVVLNFLYLLFLFVQHCTWVTSNAYSSPSVVLASWSSDGRQHIIDDFREAYYWLRMNTPKDTRILSWWDYGYQIAGFADRTTLVDNNTWNNTHIATVGLALASPEPEAYEILKQLDVDYVLVIFGGLIGYSGDDINKFLWMIRIAEGVYPDKVSEAGFFANDGHYRVDDQASNVMKESLMYKTSYYRFNEVFGGQGTDRVRGTTIQSAPIQLSTVEEAFTSENWIVRLYKVKKQDQFGRSFKQATQFEQGKRKKRKIIK